MTLYLYPMNRLSSFEVKWCGRHQSNEELINVVHSNPYYEVIAVTQGPVFLQVRSERLTLATGEILLLSPWEEHMGWERMDSGAGFFWIQFAVDPSPGEAITFDEFTRNLNIIHAERSHLRTDVSAAADKVLIPRRTRVAHTYHLFSLFERLISEIERPVGYYRMRASLLLGTIVEAIATDLLESFDLHPSLPVSFLVYRRLINYLDEYYTGKLTPRDIETRLERRYAYLCSVFKKYSGLTIFGYLQRLRIQRACHLLTTTTQSVGEVAAAVGFEDPYYFSRCFKSIMRLSPSEFRMHGVKKELRRFETS